ncbi:MAG: 5-formyltetrahydrofolate cyclo-ligase [Gammaproteobacteria bacterium]
MTVSDKQLLRRAVRAQRLSLDSVARSDAATALCSNLVQSAWYRRSKRIASYIAVHGEIDLAPFIKQALQDGKTICLPRLLPYHDRPLGFASYDPHQQLILNRFGIPEPGRTAHLLNSRFLDVVLAPLVAFDETGNRLGMGGGYYDRAFAYRRHRSGTCRPRLIGVAYDFQRFQLLPSHSWDVPLHAVYTDSLIFEFN